MSLPEARIIIICKNLLTKRRNSAILKIQSNMPYQERLRNWSCEARQPNCGNARKVLNPAEFSER